MAVILVKVKSTLFNSVERKNKTKHAATAHTHLYSTELEN